MLRMRPPLLPLMAGTRLKNFVIQKHTRTNMRILTRTIRAAPIYSSTYVHECIVVICSACPGSVASRTHTPATCTDHTVLLHMLVVNPTLTNASTYSLHALLHRPPPLAPPTIHVKQRLCISSRASFDASVRDRRSIQRRRRTPRSAMLG